MGGYDFDYFVIGAGSGGTRSARIAANHGARVAIAEGRHLGGTCVNVGCVPKKLMAYAAHFAQDFEDAAGYGWSVGPRWHDWTRLIENKDSEIGRLNEVYRNLLEVSGCRVFRDRASLLDPHTVQVGDQRFTADTILIATGGHPLLPDIPGGHELGKTSDDMFSLKDMPQRVVVVGGGYIGVEFANIFHGLGADVTQVHRGTLLLRGFDDDVRSCLGEEMKRAGIKLRFNARVTRVEQGSTCILVELRDGFIIETDMVLFALGREPNTTGLNLETVGVRTRDNGGILVDEEYRTSVDNIYAVGDVTARVQLTPVAIAEGHALADRLFGNKPRSISYRNIPTAVFSTPPIGTVGMTEAEARRQLGAVDVYHSMFRPMKHTLSGRRERTMMKLVVERASDRVLGCHMVGMDAPEIIQGFAVALNCGVTKAQMDCTIGLHPTAAEEFVTMRTKSPDPEEEHEAAE